MLLATAVSRSEYMIKFIYHRLTGNVIMNLAREGLVRPYFPHTSGCEWCAVFWPPPLCYEYSAGQVASPRAVLYVRYLEMRLYKLIKLR